jgi:hypothetical protein
MHLAPGILNLESGAVDAYFVLLVLALNPARYTILNPQYQGHFDM